MKSQFNRDWFKLWGVQITVVAVILVVFFLCPKSGIEKDDADLAVIFTVAFSAVATIVATATVVGIPSLPLFFCFAPAAFSAFAVAFVILTVFGITAVAAAFILLNAFAAAFVASVAAEIYKLSMWWVLVSYVAEVAAAMVFFCLWVLWVYG